jgi:hypothetical protein
MIPLAGNAGRRALRPRCALGVDTRAGADAAPERPLKMREMPDTSEEMPG